VLKDVLLVIASMIIWGTQVSGLQFFGYAIALGGMVYYKLGYDAIKGYAGEAGRQWADFGNRRPILRRIAIIALVLMTVFAMLNGLAPSYDATQVLSEAKNKMGLN
jgi:hypothetical protein